MVSHSLSLWWCVAFCNNTKVALCTIAKKTRVTTVKDTQTDLNILVMREGQPSMLDSYTKLSGAFVEKRKLLPICIQYYMPFSMAQKESNYKRKPLRLGVYSVQIKVAETRPNMTLGSESCQKRRKGPHYSLVLQQGGAFYSNQTQTLLNVYIYVSQYQQLKKGL